MPEDIPHTPLERWLATAHMGKTDPKGLVMGPVEADSREEALKKAAETFHIREGEVVRVRRMTSDECVAGPLIMSLSRLKSFRKDDQEHEAPLGALVEVEVNENWAPFDIQHGPDGEELCSRLVGKAHLFVVHHYRDCDGTPLYLLGTKPVGPPEGCNIFSREMTVYYSIVQQMHLNGVSGDSLKVLGQTEKFRTFKEWLAEMRYSAF